MSAPICFKCRHFRQYQPLHFVTPGECRWEESLPAFPAWLQSYLATNDSYYGPKRGISTMACVITECATFSLVPSIDAPPFGSDEVNG